MRSSSKISDYGYAYSIYYDPDYDNLDHYTIPEGEELVWLLIDKALTSAVELYDTVDTTWKTVETAEGVAMATAIDKPLMLNNPLYSFGGTAKGSLRIGTPTTSNHKLHVCTRKWEQI